MDTNYLNGVDNLVSLFQKLTWRIFYGEIKIQDEKNFFLQITREYNGARCVLHSLSFWKSKLPYRILHQTVLLPFPFIVKVIAQMPLEFRTRVNIMSSVVRESVCNINLKINNNNITSPTLKTLISYSASAIEWESISVRVNSFKYCKKEWCSALVTQFLTRQIVTSLIMDICFTK